MIPSKCPSCGADPQYEGNTHTLYICGTVYSITRDTEGEHHIAKPGFHCRKPNEIQLREA